MKKRIRLLLLPVLVAFAGLAQAVAIPAVENLRISGDELLWDAVADAGGYNIYYYHGGPGRDGFVVDYLSTVKGVTAFEGLQPGIYQVVPFSQDEMVYGAITDAMPIWLRANGEVDDGSTVYSANEDQTDGDSVSDIGAETFAAQNLRITGDELQWDAVSGAGGYNIYYYQGGPSRFEITFDYLSTVKNSTAFSGLQAGLYRVVPFSQNEMTFGSIDEARSIWLRENGDVDDGSTVYSANGSGDGDEIDSGNGSGVDELVVQNLSISDDTLQWDGLAGAGGYNIYYYQGGPSRFAITFDYLSTVKNRTDFSGLQPGLYRVVPFSLNEMTFGDINGASTIWLKENGEVDDGT